VQLLEPADENEPSAQKSQKVAPFWFAGNEYFPIPQESQAKDLPKTVEYVPNEHNSQSRSVVLEHAMHPG
jgi:hypothetical protein